MGFVAAKKLENCNFLQDGSDAFLVSNLFLCNSKNETSYPCYAIMVTYWKLCICSTKQSGLYLLDWTINNSRKFSVYIKWNLFSTLGACILNNQTKLLVGRNQILLVLYAR
jgi:hypothetical protein